MNKQKKNQAIAATVALTLLVGGTYAWQSFSQTIINETAGFDADQGTRLHNDFDGSNADVYVENFASTTAGSTVYTRVRLHEYMEIGAGAGSLTGTSSATTVPGDLPVDAGNITPDITDVSTWDIYLHEGNSHASSIRDYLNLNHGDEMNANQGATVYMPTFNKNFDDTTAEINGSLNNLGNREDTDRDNATPYDDYITYSLGESISTTATYSKDALIAQESTDGVIDGTTFKIDETHTAKSTQTGSVITMEEWTERVAAGTSDQVGDYWVMDIDGWAYWANGLAPQTATSLLVDSISTVRTPDQDWHYGLHVVNQSATSDGWVDAVGAMNKGDIGEDALSLMEICWDTDAAIYEVTGITLATPAKSSLLVGEELEFSATVTTPETAEKAKTVLWTIEEVATDATSEVASISTNGSGLSQGQINASLSSTGVFKPTNTAMHDQRYIITATAKYDVTKSKSTTITVYDPDQRYDLGAVLGKTEEEIKNMVGGTGTITVNGVEFYIIGYNNTNFVKSAIKILVKDSVGENSIFGSNNTYSTSTVRTCVLDWYENIFLPAGNLNDNDVCYEGTTTRSSGSPNITTDDKAFLLSNTEASALNSEVKPSSEHGTYWLRTPYTLSGYAYRVNHLGEVYYADLPYSFKVRPALWIYL